MCVSFKFFNSSTANCSIYFSFTSVNWKSFGYDCSKLYNLCAIDDTVIYTSGNIIHLLDVNTGAVKLQRSVRCMGIGHIAVMNFSIVALDEWLIYLAKLRQIWSTSIWRLEKKETNQVFTYYLGRNLTRSAHWPTAQKSHIHIWTTSRSFNQRFLELILIIPRLILHAKCCKNKIYKALCLWMVMITLFVSFSQYYHVFC